MNRRVWVVQQEGGDLLRSTFPVRSLSLESYW
jgi:hypothetical protein